MTNEAKPEPHIKLVETQQTITPGNPFANLEGLRNPQDYEEFLSGEAVTKLNVRTLKEDMHLRVNPDPNYSLLGQYVIPAQTGRGTYFVFPQFRDALGALPRRCNLHIAVDGHGEYFLLLIKQANPGSGQEDNAWYTTARTVAATAALTDAAVAAAVARDRERLEGWEGWVRVTKPVGGGWAHIKVRHQMQKPEWPTKPMEELLYNAFPDMVVNSLSHDLIQQFKERGA